MDAAVAGIIGAAAGAVLSGGLTVTGVVLTQRATDQREEVRRRAAREQQVAQWAREDASRPYEEMRTAYLEFMKDWHERTDTIFMAKLAEPWSEPPEDYMSPLYYRLEQVQLFGSRRAADLASAAFEIARTYAYQGGAVPEDGTLDELREQVRRDLGVPEGPRTVEDRADQDEGANFRPTTRDT